MYQPNLAVIVNGEAASQVIRDELLNALMGRDIEHPANTGKLISLKNMTVADKFYKSIVVQGKEFQERKGWFKRLVDWFK